MKFELLKKLTALTCAATFVHFLLSEQHPFLLVQRKLQQKKHPAKWQKN